MPGETDEWDKDPWILNTPIGVIDLKTARTRDHAASDYLTKSSIVGPSGARPMWMNFIDRVTGSDVELCEYLQRVCGYCLTGSTREHALFFLWGTGSNGKGTLVNALLGIFGDYAQTAPTEVFMESKQDRHPTDLAMLRGARLVVASEVEANSRWAEAKIKTLTGGDRISARFMRQDFFSYTPCFKLMIAGNHRPALRTVDEAIRRRLHLIPFTTTIPKAERDPDLGQKLQNEYPGILNWALEGCLAWQQQGLNPPQRVLDATRDYLSSEDDVGQWLETSCIVSPQAGSTRANALYSSYKAWAESGNEFVLSQRKFGQKLEDRGFRKRTSNGTLYEGISLRGVND
jgi:putative DNA primase/helicase